MKRIATISLIAIITVAILLFQTATRRESQLVVMGGEPPAEPLPYTLVFRKFGRNEARKA